MSEIARLKNQARHHEAREEWTRAIECYVQAIRLAESTGVDADLSLYNRVGDLLVKVGQTQQAVEYWERGVDAYMDAGFYNNAIALCNKILRTAPGRNSVYLKLGQISARKGFLSEARRNILEYAQRMQRAGQLDEAFRALQKFADLQPEPEIRIMLADQLLAHGRVSAGVEQLRYAWRDLVEQGRQADADEVRARILEIAPDRDPEVDRPEVKSRAADRSLELDAEGIIDLPELPLEEPGTPGKAAPAARQPAAAPGQPAAGAGRGAPGADVLPEEFELGDLATGGAEAPAGEPTSPEPPAARERAAPEALEVEPPLPEGGDRGAEGVEIEPLEIEPTAFHFEGLDAEGVALGSVELEGLETEEGDAEEPGLAIEVPEGLSFGIEPERPERPAGPELDLPAFELDEGLATAGPGGPGTTEEALGAVEDLPLVEPEPPAPPRAQPKVPRAIESVEDYRNRLRRDPDDHDLRVRLAELLLEEGRRPEALRELRRALEGYESQGRIREAEFVAEELLRLNPNDVRVHQKRVELAALQEDRPRLIQAYLDLADCLDRTDASQKARAVYERVLELEPRNERARRALEAMGVARAGSPPETGGGAAEGGEGYVDLGALLEAEIRPPSTRFQVRVTEPGSEDEFDFAEMLAQFKAKVAEAVTPEDYASHYDLGIAYREMGLLDEAIAEFQIAARADSHRLRAHEMLGRCFLEKGEYRVAQKVLTRALQQAGDVEESALVAVYYGLGRVHEALGEPGRALEFYERAMAIDIGFEDVAARVRALRGQPQA
jgi:tetratricopeptide (TPR) repeat protein